MAAPPDPQDELLPRAGPGSQWFGDQREGKDEAVTPNGAQPAAPAGEPVRGLGAGAGEAAPRDPGSGPARPPPVAMETASTGKAAAAAPQMASGTASPSPSPSAPPASAPSRALCREHQPALPAPTPPPPRSSGLRENRSCYFQRSGRKILLILLFKDHRYLENRPHRQTAASWRPCTSFFLLQKGVGAAGPSWPVR